LKRADDLPARLGSLFLKAKGEPRWRLVEGPGEVVVCETSKLAVAGAIHERVDRVVLYTAFRTHTLSFDESADAALLKLALDEENEIARRHLSWLGTTVPLRGWATRFEHVKIEKDAQGYASVDLLVKR